MKTPEKQATYRTPNGAMKQMDYILVDKKRICCSRDAEANDMIHIGSDHRSVMARFVIKAPNKRDPRKKRRSENIRIQNDGKEDPDERNAIDERHHELECSVKQEAEAAAAAQKQKGTEAADAKTRGEGGNEGKAEAPEAHAEAAVAAVAAQKLKDAEAARKKTQAASPGEAKSAATKKRSKEKRDVTRSQEMTQEPKKGDENQKTY